MSRSSEDAPVTVGWRWNDAEGASNSLKGEAYSIPKQEDRTCAGGGKDSFGFKAIFDPPIKAPERISWYLAGDRPSSWHLADGFIEVASPPEGWEVTLSEDNRLVSVHGFTHEASEKSAVGQVFKEICVIM